MKRILVSGYYGFGNRGDDSILYAIIQNLNKLSPDLDIVALSKRPEQTAAEYNIKAINRFNLYSIIYQIIHSDLVISGGGSLLQDVTSTMSLFYYLSIIMLAKLFRKPVMLYANGIGPIRKKSNRLITRLILNKVEMITLRDEDSRQQLKSLKINRPEITVCADPVFTIKAVDKLEARRILNREHINLDKPLIGISIRKWKTKSDYQQIIASIADELITKYKCNILFISMQMPDDSLIIADVQKRMQNRSYTIKEKYNVQEYMAIIGKLQVLISMRLHTLIFAAVQRVPMIGLVYDPKIQSFLDLVEQPSAGDIDNIDIEKLFGEVDAAFANREPICELLQKHISVLRQKAEINDRMAIELLKRQ